jgi:pSer/pThr/pTyr-binding forkhead associated (FHA) protein
MKVRLVTISGGMAGMEIAVCTSRCLIGRGEDCHIRLPSGEFGGLISRRHCIILTDGDMVVIKDCSSVHGTLVNGKPIHQRYELKNGDWITMGTVTFEVRIEPEVREEIASEE